MNSVPFELVVMMEECGELVRACSKIIRHGTDDEKYRQNLIDEMGDVQAMISLVSKEYSISEKELMKAMDKRILKMKRSDYE